MSTRAVQTSIQALSPELILGVAANVDSIWATLAAISEAASSALAKPVKKATVAKIRKINLQRENTEKERFIGT